MNDEDMKIAIAKRCGWTFCDRVTDKKTGRSWDVYQRYGVRASIFTNTIPNYPNDLNAIVEAENTLSALDHQKMCLLLHKNIMGTMDAFDVGGACNLECVSRVVKATALQRAEAFLRAVGDWKETA